jgi:hypothetical protein
MNLSTHLTLEECIVSDTAKRLGISNHPTEKHLESMKLLAENIFEPIRNHFGKPIYVTSGYRSEALNKALPGTSATSQHCKGEALDLDQDGRGTGVSNLDVFNFIKNNLNFDQLIWEYGNDSAPDWVHVSYSPSGHQRKSIIRAHRTAQGGVTYTKY